MSNPTAERADLEMALTRILSVHGLILSGQNMSPVDRRERIRVAVMRTKCQDAMFNEELTFAQAYQRCYAQSVELRKSPRGEWAPQLTEDEEDTEVEEDTEDDENENEEADDPGWSDD